jgi:hypothetical protein
MVELGRIGDDGVQGWKRYDMFERRRLVGLRIEDRCSDTPDDNLI